MHALDVGGFVEQLANLGALARLQPAADAVTCTCTGLQHGGTARGPLRESRRRPRRILGNRRRDHRLPETLTDAGARTLASRSATCSKKSADPDPRRRVRVASVRAPDSPHRRPVRSAPHWPEARPTDDAAPTAALRQADRHEGAHRDPCSRVIMRRRRRSALALALRGRALPASQRPRIRCRTRRWKMTSYFFLTLHGLPNRDLNRSSSPSSTAARAPLVLSNSTFAAAHKPAARTSASSRASCRGAASASSRRPDHRAAHDEFEAVALLMPPYSTTRWRARSTRRTTSSCCSTRCRRGHCELELNIPTSTRTSASTPLRLLPRLCAPCASAVRLLPACNTTASPTSTTGVQQLVEPDAAAVAADALPLAPSLARRPTLARRLVPKQQSARGVRPAGGHDAYLCPQSLFKFHPDPTPSWRHPGGDPRAAPGADRRPLEELVRILATRFESRWGTPPRA